MCECFNYSLKPLLQSVISENAGVEKKKPNKHKPASGFQEVGQFKAENENFLNTNVHPPTETIRTVTERYYPGTNC